MTTLHGSNLPLLKVLASPFVSLHQALTVCEDCWTWSTINGDVYEDVVLLKLTHETVTIEHKYGVSTIARSDLVPELQQCLTGETEMADADSDRPCAHAHAEHFRQAA